jgi:DNA polymerase III epsilon subunit-like protein
LILILINKPVKKNNKKAKLLPSEAMTSPMTTVPMNTHGNMLSTLADSIPLYMILDVETTGLPTTWGNNRRHRELKVFDNCRPVSVAWSIVAADLGIEIKKQSYLIKSAARPPIKNSSFHGVTDEKVAAEGIDISLVHSLMKEALNEHQCVAICSYNIMFDLDTMNSEFYRKTLDDTIFDKLKKVCFMQNISRVINPGQKYYKLTDVYQLAFGSPSVQPHSADGDVQYLIDAMRQLMLKKKLTIEEMYREFTLIDTTKRPEIDVTMMDTTPDRNITFKYTSSPRPEVPPPSNMADPQGRKQWDWSTWSVQRKRMALCMPPSHQKKARMDDEPEMMTTIVNRDLLLDEAKDLGTRLYNLTEKVIFLQDRGQRRHLYDTFGDFSQQLKTYEDFFTGFDQAMKFFSYDVEKN